jgi:hypothetical protein
VDHGAGPQRTRALARWSAVSAACPHRRRVLAAGATLLLAGPAALTGCAVPVFAPQRLISALQRRAFAPPGPDPLESPARRAEADAALAAAVAQLAAQADPVLAATARALAADRMTHAATLRAELRRVRPRRSSAGGFPPVAPPKADPDLATARGALTQAVRAAHEEAAGLVMTLPGYRAALLASIAACCASHAALLS